MPNESLEELVKDDSLRRAIEAVIAHNALTSCCLCRKWNPQFLSAFFPNDDLARRIGQADGRTRVVVYALCGCCQELPDREMRVERKILRDFQRQ
jgi:hypothetical protein